MTQAISDFVSDTTRLRIFEQAEAAMDEQLRATLFHAAAILRNDRKQEIAYMHFDCEADAIKYVEDCVLADMDVVCNSPPYCSFMARLTKVRTNVRETRMLLSKLDMTTPLETKTLHTETQTLSTET